MLDTFFRIDNLQEFINQVRNDVVHIFLLSYKNSRHFIEKYNDSLLSEQDIRYEMSNFTHIKNNEIFFDGEQRDNLVKAIYQTLVFKILSKLVDDGILELCWDDEIMNFTWRKKKYARISKVIKIK
jgi:hypothetical protein